MQTNKSLLIIRVKLTSTDKQSFLWTCLSFFGLRLLSLALPIITTQHWLFTRLQLMTQNSRHRRHRKQHSDKQMHWHADRWYGNFLPPKAFQTFGLEAGVSDTLSSLVSFYSPSFLLNDSTSLFQYVTFFPFFSVKWLLCNTFRMMQVGYVSLVEAPVILNWTQIATSAVEKEANEMRKRMPTSVELCKWCEKCLENEWNGLMGKGNWTCLSVMWKRMTCSTMAKLRHHLLAPSLNPQPLSLSCK